MTASTREHRRGCATLRTTGLIGFSAAPVFSLLTLTTADRVGPAYADRTIGLQVARPARCAHPGRNRVLLSRTNVQAPRPALLVLCGALLALYATFDRR